MNATSVIRCEKARGNFSMISNVGLRDKRLDMRARGLLAFCLALPDNWEYSIKGLAAVSGESEGKIRASLQELEKCGYLTRTRVRNAKGQIAGMCYTLREEPLPEDFANCSAAENHKGKKPCVENPHVENPHVDNLPQIKTNLIKTKLNNNNIRTQDSNSLLRENAHARGNLQPIPFTPPAILDRQQRTGKRQPLTVDEQEKATEWFEDFWDVYPKKQGKVEARLAWLRLDYDTELYANIIQTVERFKAIRRDWQKAGGRYVPMPENFLINERWKDEVAEEPALDFDRPMDLATAGALLEEEWRRQNAAFGKTGGDSGKVQGEIPQLGDYL